MASVLLLQQVGTSKNLFGDVTWYWSPQEIGLKGKGAFVPLTGTSSLQMSWGPILPKGDTEEVSVTLRRATSNVLHRIFKNVRTILWYAVVMSTSPPICPVKHQSRLTTDHHHFY